MEGDACLPDRPQTAREILGYLTKHPDAQDTLEGILHNWLPGQGSRYNPIMVLEVLKDLILQGTMLEISQPGSSAVYRLNVARKNRMKELIKGKKYS